MSRARAVLFTSEEERELSRNSYTPFPTDLRVVSYCAADPPANMNALRRRFLEHFPALQGRRIVLFLGRIHAVKGCDMLVRAFSRVCEQDPNLRLVIAGPDPTNLVAGLERLSSKLGIAGRVIFPGGLYEEEKWGALAAADLFVACSHAECFGVSMVAAMAAGAPVAISNKVNTWREIMADGAGFLAGPTVDGTHSLLRQWLNASEPQLAAMGENARRSFRNRYSPRCMAPRLIQALEDCGVRNSLTPENVSQ